MKQLWFTSSKFKPLPGEEEKTNPGRFGQDLANWIKNSLENMGYRIEEEPIPEDWGWVVILQRKPFSLWIGCGNEDGEKTRWGIFVEAKQGIFQRLFKKIDTKSLVLKIENDIERLVMESGFEDIEWEHL